MKDLSSLNECLNNEIKELKTVIETKDEVVSEKQRDIGRLTNKMMDQDEEIH